MTESAQNSPEIGPDITGLDVSRDYSQITTLLDYFGRALLSLGTPSFRVESALQLFAARMGADAQVMATPTNLVVTVRKGEDERTFMVRENPGPTDLGKMARLADIMNDLQDGKLSTAAACRLAVETYRNPSRQSVWITLLAYIGSSAFAAALIGGGWREMILAALLGVVAAVFKLASERFEPMRRLHIPLASVAVSFFASLYCSWQVNVSYIEPTIAGLITLLPGLTITTATRELAISHVLAGSARMAGAAVVLLAIIFGVGIGATIADLLVQEPFMVTPTPLSPWLGYIMAPLMGLSLALRFQAEKRDWPVIMATCLVTLVALDFQAKLPDPTIGAFLIATAIGVLGNVYARFMRRPGTIVQLPGLLLLVPGTISLMSVHSLLLTDVVGGLEGLLAAMLTAIALATGLVLASVVMPPKTDL